MKRYIAGETAEQIGKDLRIHEGNVRKIVYRYTVKSKDNWIHFGSKKEPYFTEHEMLYGYKSPTYEELSEDEKRIYDETL